MQPTAPHATIEILQSSINQHGRTHRISCACTVRNECFIANALVERRSIPESRPAITFVSGRGKAGQIERSADSRSPFPCGLNVAVPHFCGSDRGGRVLSAANIPTREVEQMGPSFV